MKTSHVSTINTVVDISSLFFEVSPGKNQMLTARVNEEHDIFLSGPVFRAWPYLMQHNILNDCCLLLHNVFKTAITCSPFLMVNVISVWVKNLFVAFFYFIHLNPQLGY
ncbi:ankyrin repeat domain-containing protein 27 [Platysternon megacephalum]|uniref:Ankyrin repeat domain-containing protein 27 n=1 Tax=Platysternon megacephalum TaxID=55544 RepID=A0A4D9FAD7_9SAUR|nr:ankyrin repeat domain-containing protein 27 [Platysternon megacephalum]